MSENKLFNTLVRSKLFQDWKGSLSCPNSFSHNTLPPQFLPLLSSAGQIYCEVSISSKFASTTQTQPLGALVINFWLGFPSVPPSGTGGTTSQQMELGTFTSIVKHHPAFSRLSLYLALAVIIVDSENFMSHTWSRDLDTKTTCMFTTGFDLQYFKIYGEYQTGF